MIEVFTTNIQDKNQAAYMLNILETNYPNLKINIDIDDVTSSKSCNDSILRVEGIINPKKIIETVKIAGYSCAILEDKICKQ